MDLLTGFVFLLLFALVVIVGAVTIVIFAIKNFPIITAIIIASVILYVMKKIKK